MGACYSECEESVTPNHLGDAARTYQQQHQTDPQIEPQQQQQTRQTIQDIFIHPVTSNEVQQEAFKDGVDFFDMRLKQKSQELSPGFPPSRVERLSESSVGEYDQSLILNVPKFSEDSRICKNLIKLVRISNGRQDERQLAWWVNSLFNCNNH